MPQTKNNEQSGSDINRSVDTSDGFFQDLDIEFLVHELKDPISIIETGVRTLLEKRERYGGLSPKQEKTLKRILRNSRKARDMLYNLLEVGRSEAGVCINCRFQPDETLQEVMLDALDLKTSIATEETVDRSDPMSVRDLLERCGIAIEISSELSGRDVYQDEIKFRQIMGNLIKNALHHRKDKVEVRAVEEDGCLLIDVSDDGPGVPPQHRDLIFRRYVQARECEAVERRGHGLGLAGALIIARCLGGDIQIRSAESKGATFRLILPIQNI